MVAALPLFFACSEKNENTVHQVKIQQPAVSSGYVPYYTNPPISEFHPKIQKYLNENKEAKKYYLRGDINVEEVLGRYWQYTDDKETSKTPAMQALKDKSIRNK